MLKARAGFELMSYSTVVNSLTNCAKLLDGIFGYLKKKIIFDFAVYFDK